MANESNLELIARIAEALGALRERFVFVGGCATGLLITDPAAAPVRATTDVDAIVAVVSQADYRGLSGLLRGRGFMQTLEEGEPPYRWTLAGMKLDVMPTSEAILGFSNRWYVPAMQTAVHVQLRENLSIRLVAPAYFIATKLEAFLGRGEGDYLASHDLEDVLSVVDGRPELVDEIAQADSALRDFRKSPAKPIPIRLPGNSHGRFSVVLTTFGPRPTTNIEQRTTNNEQRITRV